MSKPVHENEEPKIEDVKEEECKTEEVKKETECKDEESKCNCTYCSNKGDGLFGLGEYLIYKYIKDGKKGEEDKKKMFKIKVAQRGEAPVFKFLSVTKNDNLWEKLEEIKKTEYKNVAKTKSRWVVVDEDYMKQLFEKNDCITIMEF